MTTTDVRPPRSSDSTGSGRSSLTAGRLPAWMPWALLGVSALIAVVLFAPRGLYGAGEQIIARLRGGRK